MEEKEIKEKYKHGDDFTATIHRIKVKGKISICVKALDREGPTRVFFCTNERQCDGSRAVDKLGFQYSWVYDNSSCSDIEVTAAKKLEEINNNYSIF